MDQCEGPTYGLQLLNAILAALNVALATWLANRRLMADRERRNGGGSSVPRSISQQMRETDSGGPTDGPAAS